MAPPWKSMMTSTAVWAIILAHFSENWGFYTLLTGLPMFMRGNYRSMTRTKLKNAQIKYFNSDIIYFSINFLLLYNLFPRCFALQIGPSWVPCRNALSLNGLHCSISRLSC